MMSGGLSVGIRAVAALVVVHCLAGCTVNVRSADAIDRQSLANIHVGESRKDVEHVLGQPGEYGIRLKNGGVYKVAGYVSYSGTASIGKAEINVVAANAYYQHDRLFEYEDGYGSVGAVAAYSDFANKLKGKLVLGKTDMNAVIAAIGDPHVSGRILRNHEAHKELQWFVSTKNEPSSYIEFEFDESGVLSSVAIYADHDPNMLSLFAHEFAPSLKMVDFRGMYAANDKAKSQGDDLVRKLLASSPKNISSIIKVFGKPNTVGFCKSVVHPSPLLISLWDTIKAEKKAAQDKDNHVILLRMEGFLLEVKHDVQGKIKEITWTPYK